MSPLILILLLLLLFGGIGTLPNWNYASSWGYGPSGIIGLLLVVVLILALLGKL